VLRPNLDGVVDRTVAALRLDPVDDTTGAAPPIPLAVLFRYACHATAMGGQNYLITADYPGAARRYVERAYDGAAARGALASHGCPRPAAMFLPGCFGNLRPHLTTEQGGFRSATWEELAALGRQLGSAAVAAAEQVRDPTSARRHLDLAGPTGAATETIDLPLEPNAAGRTGWPAEIQVVRLGGVYLVGLPGEVFCEIGFATQGAVAAAAGVPPQRVLVQGYSNGGIGYVPTAAAIPEGGYEVGAWKMTERPAGFTGDAERLFAETAARLAATLA
jgi:hypothetical protein